MSLWDISVFLVASGAGAVLWATAYRIWAE